MATLCKLCDKKIGFFVKKYSIGDAIVCKSCYYTYKEKKLQENEKKNLNEKERLELQNTNDEIESTIEKVDSNVDAFKNQDLVNAVEGVRENSIEICTDKGAITTNETYISSLNQNTENDETFISSERMLEVSECVKSSADVMENDGATSATINNTTAIENAIDRNFSDVQLDYIKKYKSKTISVLSIPQEVFDKKFCESIIKINAHSIMYIPKEFITLELCQLAVEINRLAIKDIPEEFRKQIGNYEELASGFYDFEKEEQSIEEMMEEYIPGIEKQYAPDSGIYEAGGSLYDQFEYYREHDDC